MKKSLGTDPGLMKSDFKGAQTVGISSSVIVRRPVPSDEHVI